MQENKDEIKSLVIRPIMNIKEAKESFDNFEKIKQEVLKNGDMTKISGKNYVNKSGWRKIKTMFGFSEEILRSRKEIDKDGTIRWIYRVKVSSKNGIFADAEASCDTKEDYAYRNKEKKIMKPENMIQAMAQTRSFNRAISDLVGGEGLSAEDEIEGNEEKPKETKLKLKCADCGIELTEKVAKYSLQNYNKELCIDHQKNY